MGARCRSGTTTYGDGHGRCIKLPTFNKSIKVPKDETYGNHLRVSDCNIKGMVSFDCGVASMFGQWHAHIGDEHASIQYVGVFESYNKIELWHNLNSNHSHAMCVGLKWK
jgi:hypothetical protein